MLGASCKISELRIMKELAYFKFQLGKINFIVNGGKIHSMYWPNIDHSSKQN